MKIAFFVQYLNPSGTYFRWHNLAQGLKKLGHEVIVFSASYDKKGSNYKKEIDGILYDVLNTYFPGQSIFGQYSHPLAYLKRYLKKYDSFDVIHVFQPFGSAIAGWKKASHKAKIKVYDWDDLWAGGLVNKKSRYIYNHVLHNEQTMPAFADTVTVCSHFLKKRAEEYGAPEVNIIYNGFWEKVSINKRYARMQLGLKEDAFYIGFMGRTIDEISWCYALLNEYRDKIPHLRMALCGMPKEQLPDYDGNLVDYLGYILPERIKYFSAALNIGLLPLQDNLFNQSRFPIKFSDYLSTSTPVYASGIGECNHISVDEPLVFNAGKTKKDFLANFEPVFANLPVEENAISNTLLEVLDWHNISKRLVNIYETALKNNSNA